VKIFQKNTLFHLLNLKLFGIIDIMEKITKMICTLGPASANYETLHNMYAEGMNIARLNMSHGTHATHQALIDTIAPLRASGLKLLVDTKGPEIRIGTFENGSIMLQDGDRFTFTTRDVIGNNKEVSLKYKNLVKEVKKGYNIFANNGMLILTVTKVTDTDILCRVRFGGKLSNNKGLNVPGVVPSTPYLSKVDKEDILFAIQNNADYLAISFVSCAKNVKDVRKFLDKNGGNNIKIISKIENLPGVENVEDILKYSDGLMVARGDLGVEVPLERIPPIQKKLISLCNVKRKICVVATEMLESMTTSTRPTRAEVNDVATAIYEEATAVMLSGETASGIDPVNVVRTMQCIITETEKYVYKLKIS